MKDTELDKTNTDVLDNSPEDQVDEKEVDKEEQDLDKGNVDESTISDKESKTEDKGNSEEGEQPLDQPEDTEDVKDTKDSEEQDETGEQDEQDESVNDEEPQEVKEDYDFGHLIGEDGVINKDKVETAEDKLILAGYELAEEKYNKEKYNGKFQDTVKGSGARNVDIVSKLVQAQLELKEVNKYSDEGIKEVENIIKELKKTDTYLFNTEPLTVGNKQNGKNNTKKEKTLRDGLREMIRGEI